MLKKLKNLKSKERKFNKFLKKIKLNRFRKTKNKSMEFTAYIVLGNRQAIKRQIKATKKFEYKGETYLIKEDSIFTKVIDGKLKAISVYRQGNPNPFNFEKTNTGITKKELEDLYGEDVYNMLVKVNTTNKMLYMMLITLFMLGLNVLLFYKVFFVGV